MDAGTNWCLAILLMLIVGLVGTVALDNYMNDAKEMAYAAAGMEQQWVTDGGRYIWARPDTLTTVRYQDSAYLEAQ
jgi:hypothetical protein